MSLTLHLGVVDQPYRARSGGRGKKAVRAITTSQVAQILEDKYGVIATYFSKDQKVVVAGLEKGLTQSLEALLMGQHVNPWAPATALIEQRFRDFINSRQAERVGIPGTPTKAALLGINHRYKHPYAKRNPRRPSFRDTGLYVTSFRAWVD